MVFILLIAFIVDLWNIKLLLLCLNCVPVNFRFTHCKTGIPFSDIAVYKIM